MLRTATTTLPSVDGIAVQTTARRLFFFFSSYFKVPISRPSFSIGRFADYNKHPFEGVDCISDAHFKTAVVEMSLVFYFLISQNVCRGKLALFCWQVYFFYLKSYFSDFNVFFPFKFTPDTLRCLNGGGGQNAADSNPTAPIN